MVEVEERDRIRELLVERARSYPAITAAAAVGSTAEGGDRWSDIDLTFAVRDGSPIATVLADWTWGVEEELGGSVLFDLPVESTIYRVFLLPVALQVDLSFTPAAAFGARGPRFRLLFGEVGQLPPAPMSNTGEGTAHEFGLAVHYLVRVGVCVERSQPWQAEYWLHLARDITLSLACGRLSLRDAYGRGFDRLPSDVTDGLAETLPADLSPAELRRCLRAVTEALLREGQASTDLARAADRVRRLLTAPRPRRE